MQHPELICLSLLSLPFFNPVLIVLGPFTIYSIVTFFTNSSEAVMPLFRLTEFRYSFIYSTFCTDLHIYKIVTHPSAFVSIKNGNKKAPVRHCPTEAYKFNLS